ncbi:phenylalanine--tRNA ligase subunit alpha [Bacteroidia bacterium]|jgi:phenylalanyl-tRNA synthetase alpha chain|nr:phenylalanine--tRNA ligase subunit alpha [Bacteroidia bacterium]|tara:strand:+ start:776 stop:1783 length:1008 start_codon:yes stop_codon:yes gene_type:complete
MKERIDQIIQEAQKFKISTKENLEDFRLKFLVKKGLVNKLFVDFKELGGEEKKIWGKELNIIKQNIESIFKEAEVKLNNGSDENVVEESLPGFFNELGSRHPVSSVVAEMTLIFERLGFSVASGPEIEDDWHNFSALNFPANHPARDMQDTFFVEDEVALRTHTSSVQVRLMEEGNLPIRSIMPGRVYRNEAISARSNCFFHQVEGLYIDKGVSFSDLKQTLYNFVQEFFGANTKVRFRASYFPFTEPSAEMDIYLGTETESDYKLTKGTGWLEILGCGMVDPNVLENCKLDTTLYSGFAFGLGVDRIAMLKYGVKDLRTFFQNDTRFLNQFNSI